MHQGPQKHIEGWKQWPAIHSRLCPGSLYSCHMSVPASPTTATTHDIRPVRCWLLPGPCTPPGPPTPRNAVCQPLLPGGLVLGPAVVTCPLSPAEHHTSVQTGSELWESRGAALLWPQWSRTALGHFWAHTQMLHPHPWLHKARPRCLSHSVGLAQRPGSSSVGQGVRDMWSTHTSSPQPTMKVTSA